MNLAAYLLTGPIIKPTTPTQQIMDWVKDNSPCTSRELADGVGLGTANAATLIRQLWRSGKVSRLEGTPIKYSYVEPRRDSQVLHCHYCGNELSGHQKKFCSQLCNTKTQQMKKRKA